MPTLTRLIIILAIAAACLYGAMLALVQLVSPVTTEMTVRVPAHKMVQPETKTAPAPAASVNLPYADGVAETEDAD